jgi:hypothetical protein
MALLLPACDADARVRSIKRAIVRPDASPQPSPTGEGKTRKKDE